MPHPVLSTESTKLRETELCPQQVSLMMKETKDVTFTVSCEPIEGPCVLKADGVSSKGTGDLFRGHAIKQSG